MTQIQPWQYETNFKLHPMYGVWLRNIQSSIMKTTEWVDQSEDANPLWVEYRNRIQNESFEELWTFFPDTRLCVLWEDKAAILKTWLIDIYDYYLLFSNPAPLAEIYKEKIEQALDFMVDVHESDSPRIPPLLRLSNNDTIEMALNHADKIVTQRKLWIQVVAELEQIRLATSNAILNCQSTTDVTSALREGNNTLKRNRNRWISILT